MLYGVRLNQFLEAQAVQRQFKVSQANKTCWHPGTTSGAITASRLIVSTHFLVARADVSFFKINWDGIILSGTIADKPGQWVKTVQTTKAYSLLGNDDNVWEEIGSLPQHVPQSIGWCAWEAVKQLTVWGRGDETIMQYRKAVEDKNQPTSNIKTKNSTIQRSSLV